jgi:hypothetical protein
LRGENDDEEEENETGLSSGAMVSGLFCVHEILIDFSGDVKSLCGHNHHDDRSEEKENGGGDG